MPEMLDKYAQEHGIQDIPVRSWRDTVILDMCYLSPPLPACREEIVGYVPDFAHAQPGSRYEA